MPDEFSALDGAIKRVYAKGIQSQQNFKTSFAQSLPIAADKPLPSLGSEVSAFKIPMLLTRRQTGGAINATESFPSPETGTKKQGGIVPKLNVWEIDITKMAIVGSQVDGAIVDGFASQLDFDMQDALESFRKDRERQLFGNGLGTLATLSAASSSSTTVTVDTGNKTQYLFPGMRIDIYNGSTLEVSNALISSIDVTNATFTTSAAVTASSGGTVVRHNTKLSAPTDGKEIMGLRGISDDGDDFTTFQELSRTTYPVLNGTTLDSLSTAITNDILQRLADKVESTSGRMVERVVSHRNQRRMYLSLVTPMKRFTDDKLDSGYSTLEWNGMPWDVYFECQKDSVYMFPKDGVKRYILKDIHIDTVPTQLKSFDRLDAVWCYYKSYENAGSNQPNCVGRATGLTLATE